MAYSAYFTLSLIISDIIEVLFREESWSCLIVCKRRREPFALEKIISVMLRFCCGISNLSYCSTNYSQDNKKSQGV